MKRLCFLALLLIGCASASAPASRSADVAPPSEEPPAFERILGAFVVSPTGFVLIDPRACAAGACGLRDQNESVLAAAERTGVPLAIAAAKLNLGATLWTEDEADAAYQSIRSAQALFAEAGDAVGLALCHEWIGFLMLDSGEGEIAGEHLALAHQLYDRLGDEAARDRVVGYLY
jgi:hypothetical protein